MSSFFEFINISARLLNIICDGHHPSAVHRAAFADYRLVQIQNMLEHTFRIRSPDIAKALDWMFVEVIFTWICTVFIWLLLAYIVNSILSKIRVRPASKAQVRPSIWPKIKKVILSPFRSFVVNHQSLALYICPKFYYDTSEEYVQTAPHRMNGEILYYRCLDVQQPLTLTDGKVRLETLINQEFTMYNGTKFKSVQDHAEQEDSLLKHVDIFAEKCANHCGARNVPAPEFISHETGAKWATYFATVEMNETMNLLNVPVNNLTNAHNVAVCKYNYHNDMIRKAVPLINAIKNDFTRDLYLAPCEHTFAAVQGSRDLRKFISARNEYFLAELNGDETESLRSAYQLSKQTLLAWHPNQQQDPALLPFLNGLNELNYRSRAVLIPQYLENMHESINRVYLQVTGLIYNSPASGHWKDIETIESSFFERLQMFRSLSFDFQYGLLVHAINRIVGDMARIIPAGNTCQESRINLEMNLSALIGATQMSTDVSRRRDALAANFAENVQTFLSALDRCSNSKQIQTTYLLNSHLSRWV